MPNPTAAMLVIGDEILSGRTRDANFYHLAQALSVHGFDLRELRVVADEAAAITQAVKALAGGFDHVFTSGGIGPTHDDITADCVAAAMAAAIGIREDARALLAAHYDAAGITLNDARLRMARIPDGAVLIDNPVSAAPGFSLGNVHVMAGVPSIFRAMMGSLLPRLAGGAAPITHSLRIDRAEGDLAGPLSALAAAHPDVAIGCYPGFRNGAPGAMVVIRGADAGAVDAAMAALEGLAGLAPP